MKLNVFLYSNGAVKAFKVLIYCIASQKRKYVRFLVIISPHPTLFESCLSSLF